MNNHGFKTILMPLFLILQTLYFHKTVTKTIPPSQTIPLYRKGISALMRTRAGFRISCYYLKKKHYGIDFTFHQIAGDYISKKIKNPYNIFISFGKSGTIQKINDGKLTPLILGSIPTKKEHIAQLKKTHGHNNQIAHKNSSIGVFTLNEPWECQTSGLSELVKNNKKIDQFLYPTKDLFPPSLIDLIRAVRDLENRDNNNQQIAFVHCKAGRGRSATVIAAYLAHVTHKTNKTTTADQIEAYIIRHRPQVKLNKEQKAAVFTFYKELKQTKNLENLCLKYKDAIKERDSEFNK